MEELQPPEGPIDGVGAPAGPSIKTAVAKRQRRPSVRLGDIGDQTTTLSYYSLARRTKQWHDYKHKESKGPKARAMMNLEAGGGGGEFQETLEGEEKGVDFDGVAIGSWKGKELKSRRGPGKKVRSNWVSKVDAGEGGAEVDNKFGGAGEGAEDGYHHDFEAEGSDSALREPTPRQSSERGDGNERELHFHGKERPFRARVSEGRDNDAVELEGPSDTDARDWKCGASADMNGNGGTGRCQSSEDGVRIWLDGLGLGRYAPFFEIHEVDDEVLPMLTLEDLKDMGINAVGSRRKMFSAIQKLGKGFS